MRSSAGEGNPIYEWRRWVSMVWHWFLSHCTKMLFLLKALWSIRRLHNQIWSGQCILSRGPVCALKWGVCVCVYTRSVYPQLQYSVGHADSMLITFVPLTNTVRFLLSVGSSVGTKRFWDFECQHLPLISTLCACLRARHLTPSHLFGLFFLFALLWKNGKLKKSRRVYMNP